MKFPTSPADEVAAENRRQEVAQIRDYFAQIHRLDTVALPVSSSEIRAKLAAGETPGELPRAVAEYIAKKGLYSPARKQVVG